MHSDRREVIGWSARLSAMGDRELYPEAIRALKLSVCRQD